jgi:hypothetical protein
MIDRGSLAGKLVIADRGIVGDRIADDVIECLRLRNILAELRVVPLRAGLGNEAMDQGRVPSSAGRDQVRSAPELLAVVGIFLRLA